MNDVVDTLARLSPIIAAIAASLAAVVGYLNRRKVNQLEVKVDGRLTELLELTARASHAEGRIEGSGPVE